MPNLVQSMPLNRMLVYDLCLMLCSAQRQRFHGRVRTALLPHLEVCLAGGLTSRSLGPMSGYRWIQL